MADKKNPNLLTEAEIDAMNLPTIERPPIIPGQNNGVASPPPPSQGPGPYFSAVLPANLGLDSDLSKTGYTGLVPSVRLMPIQQSGIPNTGSAIHSATESLQEATDNAQASADAASAAASTSQKSANASASYVPESNPLTATDAGTSATITIAPFVMNVSGKGEIAVNGGTISGLAYNTLYFIFYEDPEIFGGAVAFEFSLTKAAAISSNIDFFVGSIFTPLATAPDTIGNNDGGSGAQNGMLNILPMSLAATFSGSVVGNGTLTDPQNMTDGNMTTFGSLVCTGDSGSNSVAIVMSGPAGVTRRYSSATLKILRAVPTNSLVGSSGGSMYLLSYSLSGPNYFGGGTLIESLFGGSGTLALDTISIALPTGQNLSQVAIKVSTSATTPFSSGTIEADIYEAWIEAIE